jgi:hypothetical protein
LGDGELALTILLRRSANRVVGAADGRVKHHAPGIIRDVEHRVVDLLEVEVRHDD